MCVFFFFFQAEDGIRDGTVTGVQTCALPISPRAMQRRVLARSVRWSLRAAPAHGDLAQLDPRGGRGGQAYAWWTNRARGIARLRHRREKRTAVYWTGV